MVVEKHSGCGETQWLWRNTVVVEKHETCEQAVQRLSSVLDDVIKERA